MPLGGLKSVGEEYQVWKRGGSNQGCEYNVGKKDAISSTPLILRLFGRISSEDSAWKKSKSRLEISFGEEYQVLDYYILL